MMTAEQLEYAYAGDILKWDDNGDGTIDVYGMATDPSIDLDGQSCDPDWLKSAMPDWFASAANVREQHGSVAAGVGKELTHADGDKWMLKSTIVDPGTVLKVKHGVLKGYSVGIRNGKVLRGKAAGAPNGRIVGGQVVEVSLVDRPCNPLAVINIAKAVAGSDVLEPVPPVLVDMDPSLYDDAQAVDEAVDGGDTQAVDGAVDGLSLFDDLDDDEWDEIGDGEPVGDDKGLSLFDLVAADMDPPLAFDVDELDDVAELAALTDEPVLVTKGLLESLLNGPKAKKDGDHDGKIGENDSKKQSERRRRLRESQEREREQTRKHHQRMDAEAAQDANHAQQQGRRMEAGEHRARLGHYDKALSVLEYRSGVRLVRDVLDGVIVKSAARAEYAYEHDSEIVAELAELVRAEADALASGGYGGPEDVSLLLDACAAIAKMAGAAPTILKDAGRVLDESSADAAIVDVAEIVKAQVADQLSIVREAHEAELAELRAQVAKMAATPLPGGPFVGKFAMPSTPAQTPHITKALELERKAADPALAPHVAAGYMALAEQVRAKG